MIEPNKDAIKTIKITFCQPKKKPITPIYLTSPNPNASL
jgi:hypothetical protein